VVSKSIGEQINLKLNEFAFMEKIFTRAIIGGDTYFNDIFKLLGSIATDILSLDFRLLR